MTAAPRARLTEIRQRNITGGLDVRDVSAMDAVDSIVLHDMLTGAQADARLLVAVLESVLDWHSKIITDGADRTYCTSCGDDAPCKTVRIITDALGGANDAD